MGLEAGDVRRLVLNLPLQGLHFLPVHLMLDGQPGVFPDELITIHLVTVQNHSWVIHATLSFTLRILALRARMTASWVSARSRMVAMTSSSSQPCTMR